MRWRSSVTASAAFCARLFDFFLTGLRKRPICPFSVVVRQRHAEQLKHFDNAIIGRLIAGLKTPVF